MKKLLSLILALVMIFAYAVTGSAEEDAYEPAEEATYEQPEEATYEPAEEETYEQPEVPKYEAPEGANTLIRPVPGERTIKNLLATAMSPIGTTLYFWGGGWNEAGGTGST